MVLMCFFRITNIKILSVFSDFFPDLLCLQRIDNPQAKYYIGFVFFSNYKVAGCGGVIYFTKGFVNFVVENCVFYNVSAYYSNDYGYGGAIYFQSYSGACAISKVCVTQCNCGGSSRSYGMFVYFNSNRNHIYEFVSVFHSPKTPESTIQRGIVYIYSGSVFINSMNSSKNNPYQASSLYFYYSNNASMIKFSTIANNSATCNCVLFDSCGNPSTITNTNFVSNMATSEGVINSNSGQISVDDCVFYNNLQTLFSKSIVITNCWINHLGNLVDGNAIIKSSIITSLAPVPTFEHHHFSSAYCDVPTPAPTLENTPMFDQCIHTAAQTIPPEPTHCIYTNNDSIEISFIPVIVSLMSMGTLY